MAQHQQLDAHQKCPDRMRALFKKYQKIQEPEIMNDPNIVDFDAGRRDSMTQLSQVRIRSFRERGSSFEDFLSLSNEEDGDDYRSGPTSTSTAVFPAFEFTKIPGQLNRSWS